MSRALALVFLCLAGCANTVHIDGKPVGELGDPAMQPPAKLTAPCQSKAQIAALFPVGVMSAGAAERATETLIAWLLDCGARHQGVVGFYAKRDAGLAGTSPGK